MSASSSPVPRSQASVYANPARPGWTTTEFFLTLIPQVIALVVTFKPDLFGKTLLGLTNADVQLAAYIAAGIAIAVYTVSRAIIKHTSIKAAIGTVFTTAEGVVEQVDPKLGSALATLQGGQPVGPVVSAGSNVTAQRLQWQDDTVGHTSDTYVSQQGQTSDTPAPSGVAAPAAQGSEAGGVSPAGPF